MNTQRCSFLKQPSECAQKGEAPEAEARPGHWWASLGIRRKKRSGTEPQEAALLGCGPMEGVELPSWQVAELGLKLSPPPLIQAIASPLGPFCLIHHLSSTKQLCDSYNVPVVLLVAALLALQQCGAWACIGGSGVFPVSSVEWPSPERLPGMFQMQGLLSLCALCAWPHPCKHPCHFPGPLLQAPRAVPDLALHPTPCTGGPGTLAAC